MVACKLDSKECMVQRCRSCPGKQKVQTFHEKNLLSKKESDNDDGDSDDNDDESGENEETSTYNQWTMTDRAELISRTVTTEEFVNILIKKIEKITAHSYITRAQAQYLKDLKEHLANDEVIVLRDFAEKYKFIIQDSNVLVTLLYYIIKIKLMPKMSC